MITSALPDEGKSATTINLAIVLAQLGQPVLVVDTDLRRPCLHEVFNLRNHRGVSTYLSGLEDDAGGLVVPTGIENLSFLSSGPVPPNPSELLNSPRFLQLGRELLEQGFAHIILDSPAAIILVVPIVVPLIAAAGIDPVHFGLVVTLNLAIGQQTPPVASVLITACAVARANIWEVSKINVYFVAVLLVVLLICTYVPAIPMFLVEYFYR